MNEQLVDELADRVRHRFYGKYRGVVTEVEALTGPASIMLLSGLMFMLAVVWRELIRSRQLALGTPSFLIRAIHAGSGAASADNDRSETARRTEQAARG